MATARITSGAPRSRRKHVMAALAVAGHLTLGCTEPLPQDPDASPDASPDGHAVRGAATGVLAPVGMELRFGSSFEILTVTQDGAFAFDTRLEDGASYTVALVDPLVPCTLQRQTGVIDGADTAIELTCTGGSLASLAVSGIASAPTLVPGVTEYIVPVALSQPSVTVTATVTTPGDTLVVAGTAVPSGTPSAALALNLGDNPIDIVVASPSAGWQRIYRLNLRRASQLAQYAYSKANNIGFRDHFAWSVALSGDTLVVGAPQESSASTGIDGHPWNNDSPRSGAVYVFRRNGPVWRQEAYVKASNTGADDGFGESVAISGDTFAVGAPREDSAATGIGGTQTDNSALDGGAVYVFRRSGMSWQQEAYVKASNTGITDYFGASVALAGDTLVVGAPGEASAATGIGGTQTDNSASASGAVYVFHRSDSGWQQDAYVKASNTGAIDEFGRRVAFAGETLAVAAPGEDGGGSGSGDDSVTNSGAVYLFRGSGASWEQVAYLKASNTGAEDGFGASVALAGDTLAVGAPGEDSVATGTDGNQSSDGAPGSGAVYVFRDSGASWEQETYVKASNTGAEDGFGTSVALADGALVIGAPGEDGAATGVDGDQSSSGGMATDSGAAYVFRRSSGSWQLSAYVKTAERKPYIAFGGSLALSGDTLAIGAHRDPDSTGDAADSGAVFIFH